MKVYKVDYIVRDYSAGVMGPKRVLLTAYVPIGTPLEVRNDRVRLQGKHYRVFDRLMVPSNYELDPWEKGSPFGMWITVYKEVVVYVEEVKTWTDVYNLIVTTAERWSKAAIKDDTAAHALRMARNLWSKSHGY